MRPLYRKIFIIVLFLPSFLLNSSVTSAVVETVPYEIRQSYETETGFQWIDATEDKKKDYIRLYKMKKSKQDADLRRQEIIIKRAKFEKEKRMRDEKIQRLKREQMRVLQEQKKKLAEEKRRQALRTKINKMKLDMRKSHGKKH